MKVLLILNEAPLPFSSAASRWYYSLITSLEKQSNVELTLIAGCQHAEAVAEAEKLYPNGKFFLYPNKKGRLSTILRPFSYSISDEMKLAVSEYSKKVDLIHVEQTFAAWACTDIDNRHLLSIHYLSRIDLVEAETVNLKDWIIVKLMMITEKRLIKKFVHLKTCSERLSNFLRNNDQVDNVTNFPFAIDIEKYNFLSDANRKRTNTITIIANMGWYPGKSAALNMFNHIWPLIKLEKKDLKLRIVGWNAKKVLSNYLNLEDVEILENVPDIREYFYNADALFYFPSKGSGIKIKVQEAMLFGLPVITNSEGAEGLNLIDGIHGVVDDNVASIIEKSIKLLQSPDLQNNLRRNARKLIEDTCNVETVIHKQMELYHSILKRNVDE